MDTYETKVFTVISLAAIFFTIIVVFFIITLIKHHRRNIKLFQQQIKAEVNTLEVERKRIAQDLHDDLGPLLSSIKLHINCLNIISEEDKKILSTASKYFDQVIKKVRDTSNNLLPRVLVTKGLLFAVQEFVDGINSTNQFKIKKDLTSDELKLGPTQELHLFRIIQEAINNAIKHSGAKEFTLNLRVDSKKCIILKMSDNGKGFDEELMRREDAGFGLKNILSRVEILNGEMYLDTFQGKGVCYTINIPQKQSSTAYAEN